jgi:hypothetical protein
LSALLLIASLGNWLPVVAQTESGRNTATRQTSVADTEFSVLLPSFQTHYQRHGGVRTLGLPVSRDFQLLGRRVQIFEYQVLEQRPEGSVAAFDLLADALPFTHADGATYPLADPDLTAAAPLLQLPNYQAQALAAIDSGLLDTAAPDDWNGLPVNFGAMFRASLTCADLSTSQACDDGQLVSAALDIWGLPTSAPTVDPGNPDVVYLRFQRGIMQFSQSTGQTEAVPLGRWFKRVLIGTDLPHDVQADLIDSRYYAQYAPALALGLARPTELPMTSLAAAFSPSTTLLTAGFDGTTQPAPTPVFALALPTFGTTVTPTPQVGFPVVTTLTPGLIATASGTPSVTPVLASGTPSVTPVLANGTPGATAVGLTTTAAATPATPQGPDPCAGDEQILFAPKKPYVGTDVLVAATSATHHDVRSVRLTGPVKTGAVAERPGLNGWVWEWTISPVTEGWYEFTFFTDGARACALSGFNALPALGATPPPTASPLPTPFSTPTPLPSPSASPTSTPVPTPSLAATSPADPVSGACAGRLLRLNGANFGPTQAAFNGNVLFVGATGTTVPTILSWTNNTILLTVPTGLAGGPQQIVVSTIAGASSPLTYQIGAC